MKLAIIAAMDRNRVIGRDGKLPWHLPEDLQRFKRLTTGHTVLMGRRTFASIGRVLPDRRTIVITSQIIPRVETFTSLNEALSILANEDLVFAIGGASIFSSLLAKADQLFLTIVRKEYEGDTFFPEYEEIAGKEFSLVNSQQSDHCTFLDLVRCSRA